jgi:hypothetical protein
MCRYFLHKYWRIAIHTEVGLFRYFLQKYLHKVAIVTSVMLPNVLLSTSMCFYVWKIHAYTDSVRPTYCSVNITVRTMHTVTKYLQIV